MDPYTSGVVGGIMTVVGVAAMQEPFAKDLKLTSNMKRLCLGFGLVALPVVGAFKLDPYHYASGLASPGIAVMALMGIFSAAVAGGRKESAPWRWREVVPALALGAALSGGPALVVSLGRYLYSQL